MSKNLIYFVLPLCQISLMIPRLRKLLKNRFQKMIKIISLWNNKELNVQNIFCIISVYQIFLLLFHIDGFHKVTG